MSAESQDGRIVDILLVEDSPGNIALTREALEASGTVHRLHVVEDGTDAVDFLFRRERFADAPQPDMVLLDLNLPNKDGRTVLSEIKADANLAQIPIVVLTTSQADEDILRAYQLHANCYVTKPIDFHQFLRIVASIKEFWLGVVKLPRKTH
jgi:two-component system response regulator